MRAGEGVGVPGFDGRVTALRGTAFVPEGVSVWELGTSADPQAKANADYRERTQNPGDIVPADTVYVAVSPREWRTKTEWAIGKTADGVWKDVRAFDVDDIEAAMLQATAVHVRFSEAVGKPVHGVRWIGEWWSAFAARSNPPLTHSLVLSRSADDLQALLRLLSGDARIATVSGISEEDVFAFVTAGLLGGAGEDGIEIASRCLIVNDELALRRLLSSQAPLVILPTREVQTHATAAGAHTIILSRPEGNPADLKLSRIDAERFAEGLQTVGVPDERAKQLAAIAHRGLHGFQRNTPMGSGALSPPWLEAISSTPVRRSVLIGSWTEARSADLDILRQVSGVSYDALRDDLVELAGSGDPLFKVVGQSWALVSPEDAWHHVSGRISGLDLDTVETAVQTVLGDVDPALELPPAERWQAGLRGIQRLYTGELRKGIATTLALAGAWGETISIGGGATAEDWARRMVFRLLDRANEAPNADLWASLADVLPIVAEAAPDVFLREVERGIEGEASKLSSLFIDKDSSPLAAASPHTGLLWALEGLAWSPDHAARTVGVLAALSEIDPGGRLSNRPFASLEAIFLPWFPQTELDAARRLAALDALRRDHPALSWRLMLKLLPEPHGAAFHTRRPEFRGWPVPTEGVPRTEYWEVCTAIADRLLEDVGSDVTHWIELVPELDRMPVDRQQRAVEQLSGLDPANDEDRSALYDCISKWTRDQRSHPNPDWPVAESVLQQLERTGATFAPTDKVAIHLWLFDSMFPTVGAFDLPYEERVALIDQRRAAAMSDILSDGGLAAVMRLVEQAGDPFSVGFTLGNADDRDEDWILAMLDSSDPELQFARGYVAARYRSLGWPWIDRKLSESPVQDSTVRQARLLLLASDHLQEAWGRLDGLPDPVSTAYWLDFQPYGRGHDFAFVGETARKLLDYDHPIKAVKSLSLYAGAASSDPDLIAEALERVIAEGGGESGGVDPLTRYDFERLLEALRSSSFDEDRLGNLEWAILPALGFDAPSPTLERRLARDPGFFVEILSLCYRPDHDDERAEPPRELTANAWRLLNEWRIVPGSTERGGEIDPAALQRWVDDARRLLQEADRLEIGLDFIGRSLAHSRPDEDGSWPSEPVRELIERLASPTVESGFRMQAFNNRGGTSRGIYDGGAQERALVERLNGYVARIRDSAPRTAAVLSSLADGYSAEARRNDEEADRTREGFDR
jgi:hypothetical protein